MRLSIVNWRQAGQREGGFDLANILAKISEFIIPVLMFYIVGMGVFSKVKVYEAFISGAKNGIKTVMQIMPTLIGLLVAVGVLRASGCMNFLGEFLGAFTENIGVPPDIMPLLLVKMFSSSAATGLVIDVFKTHGTDSYIGILASILMSCTETIFYTMSVYFLVVKVSKTRWTLAGALVSAAVGLCMSVWLASCMT